MHQRTWLSILTLPIVTTFTYSMIFESQLLYGSRIELWHDVCDSVSEISDIESVAQYIQNEYIDEPDMNKVITGGIRNVLESTHSMNSYLSTSDLKLPDPGNGSVGVTAVKNGAYAIIISVMPNSPAFRAGLKTGEKIYRIGGLPVNCMNTWMLNYRLRGVIGSDVEILSFVNDDDILKKTVLKRELLDGIPITIRSYKRATVITLLDLNIGRFNELKTKINSVNRMLPIILDLRYCVGGDLCEAAQIGGLFLNNGLLASVYEANKELLTVSIVHDNSFECFNNNVAVLQSRCTIGAAEALISAFKKQSVPTFGESTCGLGIEKTRFFLKDGSAVDLVNRHWIGANGEYLGKDSITCSQQSSFVTTKKYHWSSGFGVSPNYIIKTDVSDNDIILQVLDIIEDIGKTYAHSV